MNISNSVICTPKRFEQQQKRSRVNNTGCISGNMRHPLDFDGNIF